MSRSPKWRDKAYEIIRDNVSLGKAESFRKLTRLLPIDLAKPLMEDKNRSDYEWDKKKRYIDEIYARRERLAKLMEEVDPG